MHRARAADQSLSLYLQMCGRALRVLKAKDGSIVEPVILDHAGNYHRFSLPQTDRLYELDAPRRKRGVADGEAPCKRCPECGEINAASALTCVGCGYVFPVRDRTAIEPGELVDMTARLEAERLEAARALLANIEQDERGKKLVAIAWNLGSWECRSRRWRDDEKRSCSRRNCSTRARENSRMPAVHDADAPEEAFA